MITDRYVLISLLTYHCRRSYGIMVADMMMKEHHVFTDAMGYSHRFPFFTFVRKEAQ